ncbi:MAG: hypothetical protein JWR72_1537 [Flavisolibacter sp.]|jgi:hypothetical protein|nr:hypothetical protein [Flavisolibacter sp.]
MTRAFALSVTLCFFILQSGAQEAIQELSKKAGKGFISNTASSDGVYTITYKIPGDKKKNEIFYENYQFDNNIKFIKSEEVSEPKEKKEDKPDKTVSGFDASVGGCGGFDLLSMKLRFSKFSATKSWDYKKQRYFITKILTSETIKPRNENGKYYGYAAFTGTDEKLFVVGATESDVHKKGRDFFILGVNADLDITSKPVDISGSQSLVFSSQLDNGDVVLVFAPKKGEPDLSAYTYLRYGTTGDVKNKVTFKSPSNNLLIVDAQEEGGSVFFCATSTKSKDSYEEVFDEYAGTISNPCYKEGENKQDFYWAKKADEKMESFHLLKFTGSQLDFATAAPVSEFKSKFKTSPQDKGADAYKGRRFLVSNFRITPSGEYLVAGQLTGKTNLGLGNPVKTYEDIVCFHFDKAGQLKAQYGVEKMNTDKKSEIFPITQMFVPSKDGKSLYWVIMEVKGFKGYDGFVAAYVGNATYYGRYFPRIAKLDVEGTSVSSFSVLGDEKFYTSKSFLPIFNTAENSLVFIGSDEDYKKLWLSKYVFQ